MKDILVFHNILEDGLWILKDIHVVLRGVHEADRWTVKDILVVFHNILEDGRWILKDILVVLRGVFEDGLQAENFLSV